ncbi:MAG: SIR2 family protein [Sulfurospirillaceae bacterium]|nr:SIR2 family protein [Sulfurospirillaceae bacterium]MDD2826183.1 SIR2 family protein [Sulfurospirillaceae bacterium]
MTEILQALKNGELIPFIGMGVFYDTKTEAGQQIPYDSDSMILALNNGRAMSARLMYEYSRAAMSLEQRKGRPFIEQMTNHIFTSSPYAIPTIYQWLKTIKPRYIIDLNMDDSLLKVYAEEEHFLITGVSRIMGGYDRFIVYLFDTKEKKYKHVDKTLLSSMLPIIFKPLGCIVPDKNFIISDADFVDWLTEAMGGYAMAPFLKNYREGKKYLFLGVDFDRDTFRMVANEITLGMSGGYIVSQNKELTKKEEKFLTSHKIEKIAMNINSFIEAV